MFHDNTKPQTKYGTTINFLQVNIFLYILKLTIKLMLTIANSRMEHFHCHTQHKASGTVHLFPHLYDHTSQLYKIILK
jgi:hypothetical protein